MLSVAPLGNEVLVNDYLHGPQRLVAEATAVAATPQGGFAVVYQGRGPTDTAGVFLRQFSATGVPAGDAVLVNTTIDGNQVSPSVASTPNGELIVVWDGRGRGDRQGIFLQRYGSEGSIGAETLVNTTLGGNQHNAHVAATESGFVVVWEGNGGGDFDGVFLRRFDSDGNPLGDEQRVNTTTASEQAFADVAMGSDGRFVVTWSSRHQDGGDWGVYAQRFAADGTRLGGEVLVNTTTAGSQQQSSVSFGADGDYTIVWSSIGQDGDGWGVYARHFLAGGTADGGEIQVNVTTHGQQQDAKVVQTSDGTWFVTWRHGVPDGSGWEVRARVVDVTQTEEDSESEELQTEVSQSESGAEIQINQDTAGPNSGHQQNPSVAATTDGGLVVAWNGVGSQDRDGVYAQAPRPAQENLPPQLEPIPDQQAIVGQQLTITVRATDPNPGDVLTFILDDESPASATLEQIDNNTAVIRWTPSPGDAETSVPFRVLVVDNGSPPLADSESFVVFVNRAPQPNQPPDLAPIEDQTIPATGQLLLEVTATDPNPSDTLTFLLDQDDSPPGATIESTGPGTAVIHWTPAPEDAGTSVPFRVLVVDNGTPQLADTESFVVTVERTPEPNQPPDLAPIEDQTIPVTGQLSLQVSATDPNPSDTLTFLLDQDDSPPGASIESTGPGTAVIHWTPAPGDAGTSVPFRVLVVDNGTPVMADTESFVVHVTSDLSLARLSSTLSLNEPVSSHDSGEEPQSIVDEAFAQLGDESHSELPSHALLS
ncbi:MAG: hypothetical protein K8T91_04160 [Planctomycetes bacterium]|nr:hypothetical protein [Planctomycetota bacterium]